jgi:predicted RNase H-like HicB family nuclease
VEYIAYLHKDGKSDFGVSFPDFPGCITAGRTLEEARRLAPEALALHIQGLMEDGETIPEPSTLDELERDPARRGAVCFVVSANPAADKAVRVNITARASQIRKIDALADRAGLTRSAFLVQSALGNAGRRGKSHKRPATSRRGG